MVEEDVVKLKMLKEMLKDSDPNVYRTRLEDQVRTAMIDACGSKSDEATGVMFHQNQIEDQTHLSFFFNKNFFKITNYLLDLQIIFLRPHSNIMLVFNLYVIFILVIRYSYNRSVININ